MDIDGEISFEYNSSGIRTKKECDGITHEYLLDGTTILCEKRSDGITLDFYYDESGNIFAMGYDGAMYYHVRNALGEIIGLIDSNGAYVAKYTYDAWGWPETIEDGNGNDVQFNNSHIANINPFRYKGYYFDNEYYFYYLQSRYYDPMACRFINADGLVASSGNILGTNLFAYCNNNPIMLKDASGCRPVFQFDDERDLDRTVKMPEILEGVIDQTSFTSLITTGGLIEDTNTISLPYGYKRVTKSIVYFTYGQLEKASITEESSAWGGILKKGAELAYGGASSSALIAIKKGFISGSVADMMGSFIPGVNSLIVIYDLISYYGSIIDAMNKSRFEECRSEATDERRGVLVITYSVSGPRQWISTDITDIKVY